MTLHPLLATTLVVIEYVIKVIALGVIPENRRPSSSSAWLLLILFLPIVGFPLYWMLGSPWVHGRRYDIQQAVKQLALEYTADLPDAPPGMNPDPNLAGVLRLNRQLTGMPCVTGVAHGLYEDPEQTYAAMVEAIDQARDHVHVQFYIMAWDEVTDPFFQALARAVERGVHVRVLLDHLGSRRYPRWRTLGNRLDDVGIEWHLMMPLLSFQGVWRRPDLRNHRKMLIVDSERAFIGSHNVIEPSYRKHFAPASRRIWKDLSVSVSGEIVVEAEAVFAMDWYFESGKRLGPAYPHDPHMFQRIVDDRPVGTLIDPGTEAFGSGGAIADLDIAGWRITPQVALTAHSSARGEQSGEDESGGVVVGAMQLVPSGPGYPTEPNLRMFISLIHSARKSLTITSPYFVPDEALLTAITTAAMRGVDVQLFVGESSDQFLVSHAQRSYYAALLAAGVRIFLYPEPTVLHSKYMTVDDEIGLIGSSNMDFRSFSLNYELMLLCFSSDLDDMLRANDEKYRTASRELTAADWAQEPWYRRYVDNVCRLTAGIL